MRSIVDKGIDAAFRFFPFGMRRPRVVGEWVVGPAFAVRAEYDEYEGELPELAGVYTRSDPLLEIKLESLLQPGGLHPVEIQPKGHRAAPKLVTDRWGAVRDRGSGKCTFRAYRCEPDDVREIGFPLYALGKKLRLDRYAANGNLALYGYRDDELLAVLAGRVCDCEVTW